MFSLMLPILGYAYLSPPQVIRLIPPDNNLENENQIEQLCPKSLKNFEACRQEKLRPITWILSVHEKPEANSKTFGEIRIIGTPGKGLQAQYVPTGSSPIEFPSDSKGSDWGYSCYFEFTVNDLKGDWIQLPKRPFSSPVWVNIKKDWPKRGEMDLRSKPRPLDNESVYSVAALGNIVFSKFSGSEFKFRKENVNDRACNEEPSKIPAHELEEVTKPISILFDKDGHLIAWPAYCRGC